MEENKNERKIIGCEPKVAIGLGILLWPIAVIALCVEQKTMTRAEKAQLIQGLVIGVLMTILSCFTFIPVLGIILGIISLLVFILIVYTAIKAFMGEYYEIPWAYKFGLEKFVKFGSDDKKTSDEASAKEANAEDNAEAVDSEVVEEKQESDEEKAE